ncbi:twin-arginine translocase TatA/TatE family subunit [Synechococcus sp. PCC 7335]|uniref:twin-arginine translocase TatA/TatE family subunit n=1 Tax=Synechococcus sp. (strain ATCC 29403 / PCC 7335) TaxID=91464 RepID=UPI0026912D7B
MPVSVYDSDSKAACLGASDMFGLGVPEMVIIGVVAVLVFGPKRIPELGGALGKTLRGFKDEMDRPDDEGDDYFEEEK